MRPLFLVLAMLCLYEMLPAQFIYTIKADSVKITNNCDTAELIIENHTQDVLGFLYNKGKGRTEFRKIIKLNDTSLVLGEDTLVLKGAFRTAINGLSLTGDTVQLGQEDNDPNGPAALLSDRTIPLNSSTFNLINEQHGVTFMPINMDFTTPYTTVYQKLTSENNTFTLTPFDFKIVGENTLAWLNAQSGTAPSLIIGDIGNTLDYAGGRLNIYSSGEFLNHAEVGAIYSLTGTNAYIQAFPNVAELFFTQYPDSFKIIAQFTENVLTLGTGNSPSMSISGTTNNVSIKGPDMGHDLSVAGTGYFADTLHLNNVPTGGGTDSVLVISNKAVHKVAQAGISNSINREVITDANYSAAAGDFLIAYASLSTSRTVTLPAANTMTNKTLIIKDESGNAATHNITVDGFGSETIDGAATKTISSNFGSLTIYSNGAYWFTLHQ